MNILDETSERVGTSRINWWAWTSASVAFIFLVVLNFYTAIFNSEQRQVVECHSAIMNDLHTNLGQALDEYPPDDLGWVEVWHSDFEAWEAELAQCTGEPVTHTH